MIEFFIIFFVIGYFLGILISNNEKAIMLILIISILWMFAFKFWAIATFIELMIGFSLSKIIKKERRKDIFDEILSNNNSKLNKNNHTSTAIETEIILEDKNYSTSKDHSEKVWNKLGYKVKNGEKCSYKFYGNEIFTPEQVERNISYKVKYSEIGLTKKLLENTCSEELTKQILIEKYGLNESKVNKLIRDGKNEVNDYDDPSMLEWIQQAKLTKGWD